MPLFIPYFFSKFGTLLQKSVEDPSGIEPPQGDRTERLLIPNLFPDRETGLRTD